MNGHITQPRQLSLGWGWLAFLLAAAALSGGGIGAVVDRGIGYAASGAPAVRETASTKFVMPDRVYLPGVAAQDYNQALDSMGLSPPERRQMRSDIEARKVRPLWLTLWDWDTQTESGDTILIIAGDYQRLFTLSSHRTRIAIPEPRSGTIELRGERSEDGIIAISFLTGSRPVAVPYMRPGDTAKLEIDTQ
ncbi:MAG TPA: hypothetical protein VF930_06180 [Stellaceae bacterium]